MNENNAEFTKGLEKSAPATLPKETEGKVERKNPLSAYVHSEFLSMLEKQEKEG